MDEISKGQWNRIEQIATFPTLKKDGRGRPSRYPREAIVAILWTLRTGDL
ncbi:MAG: hypothetical protein EHM85_14445 [Desulfobacteraceae bacterium]|nr:MAG: hypothetical protein EHM85_14445 [Desulfobacteraceae bacterium]